MRDGLGILDSAAQREDLAGWVPDSGGVVFVPALRGLGAPDWAPGARGAIFGLTRGTTRAHLARATLEAIAFEVRDVMDLMSAETITATGAPTAGQANATAGTQAGAGGQPAAEHDSAAGGRPAAGQHSITRSQPAAGHATAAGQAGTAGPPTPSPPPT